ncbi:M61 family metallopeptidase [Maricaulaceae bacterium MS644]
MLLAAFASIVAAASGAADTRRADASVSQPAPVVAELYLGEDGLIARYRFTEPAERLYLGAPLSEAVDRLRLDGEPARFEAGIAHCGAECRFTEAELTRMAPVVRGYPDYIDAGACGVWADVPAFVPLDPQTGEALAGAITVSGREIAVTDEHPSYVAVRAPERTPVCDEAGVMAEDRLGASAARMAADYGVIFGPLAPGAPQIVMAPAGALDEGVRGVRGAAAGDDLIFLFTEPGEAPPLDTALAVLSHEMAHLWIGRRARLHPQFEQAWITEGAAEYLSLKQLLRTDMASQRFVLDQLSRHISACLLVIGEARLLLNGSTQEGAFPYNCGTLIAVFADRAAQAAGSSFEAALADMIADPVFTRAQASGLDYAAGLGAHMGRAEARALHQVFLAPVLDKRARMLTALRDADLGEESRRGGAGDPGYLASVAARHVLTQLCPDGGGRFRIDSGVVLELAPACHGPAGTSELTAIDGVDPMAEPQRALDALAASCGPGGPLTLSLGDEPHELNCGAALPHYFRGFALNEARALEVLSAGP